MLKYILGIVAPFCVLLSGIALFVYVPIFGTAVVASAFGLQVFANKVLTGRAL